MTPTQKQKQYAGLRRHRYATPDHARDEEAKGVQLKEGNQWIIQANQPHIDQAARAKLRYSAGDGKQTFRYGIHRTTANRWKAEQMNEHRHGINSLFCWHAQPSVNHSQKNIQSSGRKTIV